MKVIDWNISYMGIVDKKIEYLMRIINNESTIIILQEVTENTYKFLKDIFKNYNIEYSLNYRVPSKYDTKSRKLGIVIMTSKDIKIINARVIDRCIFPERTLLVEVKFKNEKIKVLGLHSITGCDYKKAKSIQFYSFAEAIDTYKPDIVGIDANEPMIDNYDVDKMVFFDNKDKGKGAKMFFKTMYKNSLIDSLSYNYPKYKYKYGEPLEISHKINNKITKRYDFVFLNKSKFKDFCVKYDYDNSINAGSDHSLIELVL